MEGAFTKGFSLLLPVAGRKRRMSRTAQRRSPTIHDVAREAGVSRGTVSRVLNGGHNVSATALEAVNAAIRRTGYVVNRHARSLITGRSDSIGFLLTEPQERFFEDPNFNVLLRGCTQALAAHDIPLLLMIAGDKAERRRISRYITAGHVDGVLLISSHSGSPIAEHLESAGVPVVASGEPLGERRKIAYVAADDRTGAREMVRHPLSLGRRRVATITGPLDTPGGVQRLTGYREELAAAGVPVEERLIAEGDFSRARGEEAMTELLERAPDLDAVFVASDLMAQGALTVLERAGRRVPEDVAVGGFVTLPPPYQAASPSPPSASPGTASPRRWCVSSSPVSPVSGPRP